MLLLFFFCLVLCLGRTRCDDTRRGRQLSSDQYNIFQEIYFNGELVANNKLCEVLGVDWSHIKTLTVCKATIIAATDVTQSITDPLWAFSGDTSRFFYSSIVTGCTNNQGYKPNFDSEPAPADKICSGGIKCAVSNPVDTTNTESSTSASGNVDNDGGFNEELHSSQNQSKC